MSFHTVARIHAREVLDSRGKPTVEAEVFTEGGAMGRAIVPSGASTGRHEAVELRDEDSQRYQGLGVLKAVQNILGPISKLVCGYDVRQQEKIDRQLIGLDGTDDKRRLGANALLAVSLAVSHAAAASEQVPLFRYFSNLTEGSSGTLLPLPMINILSGGLHTSHGVDFQDFLAVPVGAECYADAIEMVARVIFVVRTILEERGELSLGLADEGGYGPRLKSNREGLDILVTAIERAGLRPGQDCAIALDVAASHFYRDGSYELTADGLRLETAQMVDYLVELTQNYPIVSLEDGLAEDDWQGWTLLTGRIGHKIQVLGDDLFTTHQDRIRQGVRVHAANAVLIKMNQVGTVTETLDAMRIAKQHGYRTIVSARSGETEDVSLADLAVGTDAGQVKVGSLQRSSRTAKWNQLFRIQDELGDNARWFGGRSLSDD